MVASRMGLRVLIPLADFERKRVRHSAHRNQPDLPLARCGVWRDCNLDLKSQTAMAPAIVCTHSSVRRWILSINIAVAGSTGGSGAAGFATSPGFTGAGFGGWVFFFRSSNCSLSNCCSWLFCRQQYSTIRAVTPAPVTSTELTSSMFWPPSRIWNVLPCCPPAG